MNNLYVYLSRLDKKGIKTIIAFNFNGKCYPTKVKNISDLNLNPKITKIIENEYNLNKMQYELYVESAPSFDELKDSLKKRGYKNLPIGQFTGYVNPTGINKKALVTESSTMLRRRSHKN